jgi:hypothetical protein
MKSIHPLNNAKLLMIVLTEHKHDPSLLHLLLLLGFSKKRRESKIKPTKSFNLITD